MQKGFWAVKEAKQKMKLGKGFGFFVMLLVVTQFVQDAASLPAGEKSLYNSLNDVTFSIGSGFAEVDSEVYKYTSGEYADKYVYAYRVSNIDSGVGLSFFSVGIRDGANAYDPDFDVLLGAVDPALWAVVRLSPPETQIESVNALFTRTIDDGFSSMRLWFVSDYTFGLGDGALFGMSSGVPHYAAGDLLTPIPEPATIVLLGMGVLITFARRKRSF